jgi:DNA modification methylase
MQVINPVERPNRQRHEQSKQALEDPVVHRWYRFPLAYSDHFVADSCEKLGVSPGNLVLDPFCGTGTTLVECKKRSINSIGIEANPALALISRVKTTWTIRPDRLLGRANNAIQEAGDVLEDIETDSLGNYRDRERATVRSKKLLTNSPAAEYIMRAGLIDRRWINEASMFKGIAIKLAIERVSPRKDAYQRALYAGLVTAFVQVSNMRYGPELYVSRKLPTTDMATAFVKNVEAMAEDLAIVRQSRNSGTSLVIAGDSREVDKILLSNGIPRVKYVITSPPYPNEKDYTRATRLELILMGFIRNQKDLRSIKKLMIRSNTKGIYKDDDEGDLVGNIRSINQLVETLTERTKQKTDGFARLYPRVITEYFGGMYRHLRSISRSLEPGGKCILVVGDQRTYQRTHVPTADILGEIAEQTDIGLRVIDIEIWRNRIGTTGRKPIPERVLYLEKPAREID